MNTIIAGKVTSYAAGLDALKRENRLQSLRPRTGVDFSSNDYLALASAPRMKKAIVTALEAGTSIRAGGSRLLRGNCEEHECLEAASGAVLRRADRALLRRWLCCKGCGADNVAATG